ncbi:MAG TPA: glutamyl-tRNA reductase [Gemmatimonadales bacterium]|nr:glutamyl-tRNA reductase [Gemmatimonadales bacterium]
MVGISHHTARVGVREQLAFAPAELDALLTGLRAADRHALLLSTCNRFEIYWSGPHDYEGWFSDLAAARGVPLSDVMVRLDGEAAARHLFSVAGGLTSQVVGETEVLGQVRRAYDAARAAGVTTREMDLIFSAALSAGRRVRHETSLGRHPASVSSAAVEVAAQELAEVIGDRPVVVLGAGEAAEGVLRSLHLTKASNIRLVNRNPERARTLATAWGASPHGWDEVERLLVEADLLFVATGASHPVLSAEQLANLTNGRPRPLVTMDLSVPRNVEPEARALEGVRLFDLDDLQRLCCPAAAAPAAAFEDAERVIDEELARLEQQLRGMAAAPRLAELHRHGVQVAEQEAAWALAQLEDLTDQQRLVVREMADRLVRRVLYPVSRSLREE